MWLRCVPVMVLLSLPGTVTAAVVINEVAWMGDTESPNNEWIELHNNGDADIDVSGWVLSDNDNLTIELSGTLSAGAYGVLERTDDESAPGSAFLIYTGALTNTGQTLSLRDADGVIVDQVAGGENWEEIGGDNDTKATAQLTEHGWVTAAATPGATNRTIDESPSEEDTADTTSTTTESDNTSFTAGDSETDSSKPANTGSPSVSLELPDTKLSLAIDGPTVAYVNQPVTFTPDASGISESATYSLLHQWNFGDLATSTGKKVIHRFRHPGEYVVTLGSSFVRHDQIARQKITVLPVTFSLSETTAGDILIHNDARYEVDMSEYELRSEKTVTLPPRTILLPGATLTIPEEELRHFRGAPVALIDQMGELVAHLHTVPEADAGEESSVNTGTNNTSGPTVSSSMPTPSDTAVTDSDAFHFATASPPRENATPTVATSVATPTAAAALLPAVSPEKVPYLLLIGVLSVAVVGVLAGRRPPVT